MPTCEKCHGAGVVFRPRTAPCSACRGKGTIDSLPAATTSIPAISAGQKHSRIFILGEAWGAEEARLGLPFVGASGSLLNSMLEEAGIDRKECYVSNVFNLQPQPTNDISNLGTTKALSHVPMPEMSRGVYLQDQYFPEVQRVWREIEAVRPNLVIAFGNTALWALTGAYGIRSLRGTVAASTFGPPGIKLLPTYHPAAVLRDWALRPIVVADLMKAARQSHFPEARRPKRSIWIEPSLRDIELFYHNHFLKASPPKLSADIETAGQTQITCVGFAPSPELALVIPFVDNRKADGSYWPTAHQEKLAWGWVRQFLQHVELPNVHILGQNFLYDVNWLWTRVGLTPRNFRRDTMLKHHAMNPEFEKGLGFLGSIYTDEPAWKLMNRKSSMTKRGE